MKEIKIKSLKIENFKGGSVEVEFKNQTTTIFGDNARGKTRQFDAFMWLLFGKDSNNRADFGILNWDSEGNVIHKLDAVVSATISVDGKDCLLKRVLSEKWVKPHGEENEVLSGNVTSLWVDDVPMQVGEYKKFIENMISETEFKLLTNPNYFCDDKVITPTKRREMLFDITGNITDAEIAFGDDALEALVVEIDGKELSAFRKMISEKKKKLKSEIDTFDPSIKENRIKIDTETDFVGLTVELTGFKQELNQIESCLLDESKASESLAKQKLSIQEDINKVTSAIREREFALKLEFETNKAKNSNDVILYQQQFQSNNSSIRLLEDTINSLKSANKAHVDNLNLYRESWAKELQKPVPDLSTFDCTCSLCGQKLPEEQSEAQKKEIISTFNINRANLKDDLSKKGLALSDLIKKNEATILENESKMDVLKAENIELNRKITAQQESLNPNAKITLDDLISGDAQLAGLITEKENLTTQLNAVVIPEPKELLEQKATLTAKIDELKTLLSKEVLNREYEARIKELEKQKKELGSQLSLLEKKEFQLERLDKKKVELTEEKVASIFKHTRFKMYKPLQNGGFEPVCEAMYNGVPYRDLNNAMKINLGLDIINTFSEHHGVTAPIWIDNAESIVDIIPTEGQMIKLVVMEEKANDESYQDLVKQIRLQNNIVLTK